LDHLPAVDERHHEVEQDEAGRPVPAQPVQRFTAMGGESGGVVVQLQRELDGLANVSIVVDDQNHAFSLALCAHLRTSAGRPPTGYETNLALSALRSTRSAQYASPSYGPPARPTLRTGRRDAPLPSGVGAAVEIHDRLLGRGERHVALERKLDWTALRRRSPLFAALVVSACSTVTTGVPTSGPSPSASGQRGTAPPPPQYTTAARPDGVLGGPRAASLAREIRDALRARGDEAEADGALAAAAAWLAAQTPDT